MKEFVTRIYGNEVYLYFHYDNRDEVRIILTEKEASDLATQLEQDLQDIDVTREERKRNQFAAQREFLKPTLEGVKNGNL